MCKMAEHVRSVHNTQQIFDIFMEKVGWQKIRLNMFSILYFVCFLGLSCVQGDIGGGDVSEEYPCVYRE